LSKAEKARQMAIEARNRAELKNYFANIGLAENDIKKEPAPQCQPNSNGGA